MDLSGNICMCKMIKFTVNVKKNIIFILTFEYCKCYVMDYGIIYKIFTVFWK